MIKSGAKVQPYSGYSLHLDKTKSPSDVEGLFNIKSLA